jgi:hypothetical protein
MAATPWSIEAWCASQHVSDWNVLGVSSVAFLQRLNLSSTHVFCNVDTVPVPYEIPGVPGQGPLLSQDHLETLYDVIVTVIAMGAPSIAAMAELWLRLFASILAPLGIAHLLYKELQQNQQQQPAKATKDGTAANKSSFWMLSLACIITTASAGVLLTDTLYVLEFGPGYGGALLAMAVLLSWKACARSSMHKTRLAVSCVVLLTALLVYDNGSLTFGDPNDAVKIDEGLYYDGMYRPFWGYCWLRMML